MKAVMSPFISGASYMIASRAVGKQIGKEDNCCNQHYKLLASLSIETIFYEVKICLLHSVYCFVQSLNMYVALC